MATDSELYYTKVIQDAYDGASEHYRLEQQGLLLGDQDSIAAKELKNLWMRSHHAIRNNGSALAAKTKLKTKVGVAKVIWKIKGSKDKPHKKMQAVWDEFIADPCLDGYGTLANLLDNWNSSFFESGEAITRMLIKRRPGFKVPIVLQQLESELLDPMWSPESNKGIRGSILFGDTKPITYYFLKELPTSYFKVSNFNDNERIAVDASDIIHIFERDRPGQWRGIPKLAAILLPLYSLDDLTDATVSKQKAAQALAWIVQNSNPSTDIARGSIGTVRDTDNLDAEGNPIKISQNQAGSVQYLNRGEILTTAQGADIGPAFDPLIKRELQKIASSVGIPYEVLSGDLSGISFSALKFVINEMRARCDHIRNLYIINLGLKPLCTRFQELAELYVRGISNAIPTYEAPKVLGVDDLADAKADLLEVTSGFSTLESKQRKRGTTMEAVVMDKQKRETAGIILAPEPQDVNIKPNPNSK